jgi:hypothetical protein
MRGHRLGLAVALLSGLLAGLLYARHLGGPVLYNDSYQYVDAASHVLTSGCLCNSVAHFDEQLDWGRLPVPATHFGAGYPLTIAALGLLGLPLASGGYLLSLLGYLAVIWLLWDTCSLLGVGVWCRALVCLVWMPNSIALGSSAAVMAESLFTALVMALVALMVRDLANPLQIKPVLFLLMGTVTGFAFWTRYAGLFLVPAFALYIGWRCLQVRWVWPWAAAAVLVAGVLIGIILLRNTQVTGSWKGGFNSGQANTLRTVVVESAKAAYHLVFGNRAKARLDVWVVIFTLSSLALFWRIVQNWRLSSDAYRFPKSARPALVWVGVVSASYAGGIILTGLKTIAFDALRYDFPLLPLLLILCGVLFQLAGPGIGRIAASVCVLCIAMINIRGLNAPPPVGQAEQVANLLREQVQPGISMRRWLQNALPPNATLVATDGQAAHYVLGQPVLSIIEPKFSRYFWDEAGVRSLMRQRRTSYFLLFPGAPPDSVPEQQSTPFLKALSAGQPPSWLNVAARTPDVILYRCPDCE